MNRATPYCLVKGCKHLLHAALRSDDLTQEAIEAGECYWPEPPDCPICHHAERGDDNHRPDCPESREYVAATMEER